MFAAVFRVAVGNLKDGGFFFMRYGEGCSLDRAFRAVDRSYPESQ